MPRMETLRTSAMRLPGVRKLLQRQREDDEEPSRKGEDDAFLRDPEPAKIE